MRGKELILLIGILFLGFFVRLYRFNNPIADWHSWRQADTSAVSRNFVKYGFDVFHPTYDDISNVQTGKDNLKGYRFVEFPIFNILQAGGFMLFPKLTLVEWGRLITIIATTISALFIFLLGKKLGNSMVGLFAALFFAIDPFSIYYGRVILPDPSMVTAVLGGIYFFDRWIEKVNSQFSILNFQFLLSLLFTIAALLLKPYAGFFLLPYLYIVWKAYGWKLFARWELWLFGIISFLPLVWWRIWMLQYPEGIPASTWLFNGGNIRFTGAYFYWIFAERISKLILGYWGIAVVVLGICNKKKNFGFFLSFLASTLLYLVIIARGNVQHDYYQILILPCIAFFFGLGGEMLLERMKEFGNTFTRLLVFTTCSLFLLSFGWYQVRDYFNINNPAIVSAGKAIDALTPRNALVIAPYDGDTSLLYQTNRKGWPSFEKSLPELIAMGADYLVFLHPTQSDKNLGHTYKIIALTDKYIIYNLRQKGM